MSGGVSRRRGSDPVLLWLWCKPVATAPIRSLAWKPPYAVGVAQEKAKRKKKKKIPICIFDFKCSYVYDSSYFKILTEYFFPWIQSIHHGLRAHDDTYGVTHSPPSAPSNLCSGCCAPV